MRRVVLVAAIALSLGVSCEDENEVRPVVYELHGPIKTGPPAGTARGKDIDGRPKLLSEAERIQAMPAPEPEVPAKTPRRRDLVEELRQGVGDPSSCLTAEMRAAAGPVLTIHVEAYVLDTGSMGRVTVSGTSLDAASRRCLEERVGSLRLEPPPTEAARTLSTSFELRRASP